MSVTEEDGNPTKNMQGEDENKNEGDEQIKGMSLTVCANNNNDEINSTSGATTELSDPAILVVKNSVTYRYEIEDLLKLRDAPLSQRKPDFLDINEVSPTIWDPTRWNFDRKKTDTPTENGTRTGGDILDHRRAPRDPRERIRKENDGIVLSPQRRSFNSGCFVPVRETTRTNRPHSPLGKSEPASVQLGSRRIGSGRILRDTLGGLVSDKTETNDSDYSFRNLNHQRNNQDNQDQRRNYGSGRSIGGNNVGGDDGRDKDNRRQNSRYGGGNNNISGGNGPDRRRIQSEQREQEEPEWFSGGPSSQNDTIELRGFDESEKLGCGKKKMSPSQAKRARDWYKKKSELASLTEDKDEQHNIDINSAAGNNDGRSSPSHNGNVNDSSTSNHDKMNNKSNAGANNDNSDSSIKKNKDKKDDVINKTTEQTQSEKNMNDHSSIFEDILKSDTIPGLPGLLTNGVGGDGDHNSGQSRFSKWFAPEATNQSRNESRRSSGGQEESIMKNLLKEINEPSVTIPGDSESYFAPISPAANTGGMIGGNNMPPPNSKSINIMEMLQRGKVLENNLTAQMPGRIMNLTDLEAKIRQNTEPQIPRNQQKSEEDLAAFNRLLAQVSGGHAVTANGPLSQKPQPMSLMEMLNHSQQQDEAQAAARLAQMMGPTSPSAVNNELAARIHQKQQMEMLSKIGLQLQQMRASPLQEMGVQQSRELLQRPEAQAILQGLKVGDITPQHLYQQLGNPALQPRHRELLATILKQCGTGGGNSGGAAGGGGNSGVIGHSPRVLSPVGPHPLLQQQQQQQPPPQQQLRVSPLPPNAIHQRIPSPRELQVHTQNILQRALIKKKLEEQQENYRKKQEMQQRGQSPNNNNNNTQQSTKSVASPTPLAFTPTSVLRKMTAEKDDGKDVSKLIDGSKINQGRAVTGMRQSTQQPSQNQQPPQQQSQQQNQPPQQQQQQTIGQWQYQLNMKQAGRPIVKANNFPQQQQQQSQQGPQDIFKHHQQKIYNSLQQQEQLQHKGWIGGGSNGGGGGGGHINHPQYQNATNQFSQLTQQQLRAQHQQHARPTNQQQTQQQQQQQNHMSQSQQANYGGNQSGNCWPFFNSNQRTNQMGGRGGINDGDLSPTSNQLTRWFSPDLLERARVGELPSTESLAQHVLSLEEIERITAPPVHN